jgi:hypothetical protein
MNSPRLLNNPVTRQSHSCGSCFSIRRVVFCALAILTIYRGIFVIDIFPSLSKYMEDASTHITVSTDAADVVSSSEETIVRDTTDTLSKYVEYATVTDVSIDAADVVSSSEETIRPVTNTNTNTITITIKQQQIENYRSGSALLLNLHPTHHGGTSFCGIIGRTGGPVASNEYPKIAPSFACWQDSDHKVSSNSSVYPFHTKRLFLASTPVKHDETGTYIKTILPHFHMTSWEYDGVDEMQRNVSETSWEHPDLVSVVITREPLSRLLAGGQKIKRLYPGYNMGTLSHAGWWDYASNPKVYQTDNFFFRIIEGTKRKMSAKVNISKMRETVKISNNEWIYTEDNLPSLESLRGSFDLDESHYNKAVEILNRFTVVLDIACLDDGFVALGSLLGLNTTSVDLRRQRSNAKRERKAIRKPNKKMTTQERIGYDDVYDYLVEKLQWDTKLYEYSKTISLVNCNSL